jgi:hypothetical protein
MYFLKVAMSRESVSLLRYTYPSLTESLPPRLRMREKLTRFNTLEDAIDLIHNSKRILILTGAGISEKISPYHLSIYTEETIGVSCGIPDFRSRNGLYATLQERGQYNLDDPQQMYCKPYQLLLHSTKRTGLGSTSNISGKIQLVRVDPIH